MSGYRTGDTYSAWTQDVVRLIDEAFQRGASTVEIRNDVWHVTVEWPAPGVSEVVGS